MKRKRHSVEQILRILREADEAGSIAEVCWEHNISEQTFHRWKRKYGKMEVSDAKRLKGLEEENRQLRTMVADQALHIDVLKEVNAKKWWVRCTRSEPWTISHC